MTATTFFCLPGYGHSTRGEYKTVEYDEDWVFILKAVRVKLAIRDEDLDAALHEAFTALNVSSRTTRVNLKNDEAFMVLREQRKSEKNEKKSSFE
jgi:hypothetical protein